MNGLIKEVAHALADTGLMGTVSLVAFFTVYTVILISIASRKRDPEFQAAANMPLNDDRPL